MSFPPTGSDDSPNNGAGPKSSHEEPTDFASLHAVSDPPVRRPEATDFSALKDELRLDERKQYAPRTFSDFMVAFLTPCCIVLMVTSVVYFLVDVRFVYTSEGDRELRVFAAWAFILGVVALNRLVARDGRDDSILYMLVFGGVVMFYTLSMQVYGTREGRPWFLDGWYEAFFNLALVSGIWWAVNRMTHECCVDSAPEAGDVGILTGVARTWRKRIAWQSAPSDAEETPFEAVDPTEWKKPSPKSRHAAKPIAATERLKGRHPGLSVLFFSIPAMAVFALGLRVVQHGGSSMVMRAHGYVLLYTVSALMLLMLTSLAKLREYFRSRYTDIPNELSTFWIALGTVMVAMVVVGALAFTLPPMPPLAAIDYHQPDPFAHTDFQPIPVDMGPSELLGQYAAARWISRITLGLMGLFMAYAALRGVGTLAASIARRRDRWPAVIVRLFDGLDRLLLRLSRLPEWSSSRRRRITRIDRAVSVSKNYANPLSDPDKRAVMSPEDLIAYTYDALCALALDLGTPRKPGQTPYEFMETFPKSLETLKEEAFELTQMLVLSQYADHHYDERALDRIRRFWQLYERLRARVVR